MKPALIFIISTFAQLFLFVMLLRFWLPFLRADFRNPIAQGILRITSPLDRSGQAHHSTDRTA